MLSHKWDIYVTNSSPSQYWREDRDHKSYRFRQNTVLWSKLNYRDHELIAAVVAWTRSTQYQARKSSSIAGVDTSFRGSGKLTLCLPISALIIPMSWHLLLLRSLLQLHLRLHLHQCFGHFRGSDSAASRTAACLYDSFNSEAFMLPKSEQLGRLLHSTVFGCLFEWHPLPSSGSQLLCTTIGKHSWISQGCWSLNDYSWFPGPAKQHWSQ